MLLALLTLAHAGPVQDPEAQLEATEAAAKELGKNLKTTLVAAMKASGPAGAFGMCSLQAQPMTAELAKTKGVQVGRSSLRLRNPANVPPKWVAEWLEAQGERKGAGVQGIRKVEGGEARVLIPLTIEKPCLNCHGETVAEGVEPLLAERYPDDKARGYTEGDLRGALWAYRPIAQ